MGKVSDKRMNVSIQRQQRLYMDGLLRREGSLPAAGQTQEEVWGEAGR